MFGLRFAIDCAQRWKNGQPAQSTTGAESASSSHVRVAVDMNVMRWPNIASASTMSDSGSVHQKRFRKSISSGFSPSSRLGIVGSSAMPQIGHVPGRSRTISGCIGQVYLVPTAAGLRVADLQSGPWPTARSRVVSTGMLDRDTMPNLTEHYDTDIVAFDGTPALRRGRKLRIWADRNETTPRTADWLAFAARGVARGIAPDFSLVYRPRCARHCPGRDAVSRSCSGCRRKRSS